MGEIRLGDPHYLASSTRLGGDGLIIRTPFKEPIPGFRLPALHESFLQQGTCSIYLQNAIVSGLGFRVLGGLVRVLTNMMGIYRLLSWVLGRVPLHPNASSTA